MVLNFKKLMVTVFGREKMMQETTIGHPVVSVMPLAKPDSFLDEVLITEQGERQLREISEERQREIIRNVALLSLGRFLRVVGVSGAQQNIISTDLSLCPVYSLQDLTSLVVIDLSRQGSSGLLSVPRLRLRLSC